MANGVNEFGLMTTCRPLAIAPQRHGYVGIGDDAAVMRPRPGFDAVASIDTGSRCALSMSAPADLIGYRALMVSLSDLAAMAALPRYALVALTLPELGSDQSAMGSATPGYGRGGREKVPLSVAAI